MTTGAIAASSDKCLQSAGTASPRPEAENGTGEPVPFMSPFKLKTASDYFEHVEKQITLATNKASLLLAAIAVLINGYVRLINDVHLVGEMNFFSSLAVTLKGPHDFWLAPTRYSVVIAGVLLLVALLSALGATIPKIFPNRAPIFGTGTIPPHQMRAASATPDAPNNILFYGYAAGIPTMDFVKNYIDGHASDEEIAKDLLIQAWGKSFWLRRMYRFITFSMVLTFLAIMCVAFSVGVEAYFSIIL